MESIQINMLIDINTYTHNLMFVRLQRRLHKMIDIKVDI